MCIRDRYQRRVHGISKNKIKLILAKIQKIAKISMEINQLLKIDVESLQLIKEGSICKYYITKKPEENKDQAAQNQQEILFYKIWPKNKLSNDLLNIEEQALKFLQEQNICEEHIVQLKGKHENCLIYKENEEFKGQNPQGEENKKHKYDEPCYLTKYAHYEQSVEKLNYSELNWEEFKNFFKQMIYCLSCFQSNEKERIYFRNLNPNKIFIQKNQQKTVYLMTDLIKAKIDDGMEVMNLGKAKYSKVIDQKDQNNNIQPNYLPPEMYFADGLHHLDKSDLYCLGLVIMKIFLSAEIVKQFQTDVENLFYPQKEKNDNIGEQKVFQIFSSFSKEKLIELEKKKQ
eukprot:TRINITY_DN4323_c0_g1_i1.p1 TRINITY_DN4323_c0_g1~~TRINITY_DN4323_c0_g1_i1.p1  ORF type:complete len:344 (+),score=85.19 TRINITY_DN4323_c0_g1_i1:3-1034(+)